MEPRTICVACQRNARRYLHNRREYEAIDRSFPGCEASVDRAAQSHESRSDAGHCFDTRTLDTIERIAIKLTDLDRLIFGAVGLPEVDPQRLAWISNDLSLILTVLGSPDEYRLRVFPEQFAVE